ncbi:sensor histidine kinase [Nonomuraea sp. LPB2021202275-12-8]|uniref:sensor histidine kinase n=1 Tax=Nonomuraea sp. LPB2021202275-12-8 TaxID=3120159 RepID=UPI00300C98FF
MELKPQVARALVAASLLALLAARVGQLLHPGAGPLPHRMIAIPMVVALITVYGLMVFRDRLGSGLPMTVTALLTFGPYLVVGGTWGPIAGVLGSAVLLALAAPTSWLLFALIMVADTGVSCLYYWDSPAVIAARAVTCLNVGLSLFAVVRLAERVRLANAHRQQLAGLAVARDRLGTAHHLQATIGTELSAIVGTARRLGDGTGPDPGRRLDDARASLAEIVERARRALSAAREIADTHRQAAAPAEPTQSVPVPVMFRFAWWILLLVVINVSAVTLVNVDERQSPDAAGWAAALAVLVVSSGLQLYHGAPRRTAPSPRVWPWTLAAHAVVLACGLLLYGTAMLPPVFLAVGAVTVRVRPPWSLAAGGLFLAGLAFVPDPDYLTSRLYWLSGAVMGVTSVYSLCRLPEVTRHLNETRDRLARMAVLQARLRVARDVHDFLGSGLSAIVLKGELAARLISSDPDKAFQEVRELSPIAQRTLGEVRAVTGLPARLAFTDELAAARSLLEAAGIRLAVDAAMPCFPAETETLLATVLREATTNVVRHSRAGLTSVETVLEDGVARLRVSNDGLDDGPAPSPRRGTGLDNLAERAAEAGGRLVAGPVGNLFVLTAEVPV